MNTAAQYYELGTCLVLSESLRTIVDQFDLCVEIELARLSLERSPDFEDNGVVSWGRVTKNELRALIELDETDKWDDFVSLFPAITVPDNWVTLLYGGHRGE